MYINGSVGKDGQNARNDVRFVQELLTLIAQEDMRIPRLTVDGLSGPQTHQTIHRFQEFYVKLRNPDSRIDPGGRSERTLIAKIIEIDEAHLKTLAGQYGLRKTAESYCQIWCMTIKRRLCRIDHPLALHPETERCSRPASVG